MCFLLNILWHSWKWVICKTHQKRMKQYFVYHKRTFFGNSVLKTKAIESTIFFVSREYFCFYRQNTEVNAMLVVIKYQGKTFAFFACYIIITTLQNSDNPLITKWSEILNYYIVWVSWFIYVTSVCSSISCS